jgi:DNA-binding response OmpR family regulator
MRLLIVDDEYDIVELIAEECQSYGLEVDFAYHGDQAREFCLKNNKYDVILTDLNMPRFSGVELINWVRTHSNESAKIIVMTACTASHPNLDLKLIDHLVLKPFRMQDLMEVITHFQDEIDAISK